MSKAHWAQAALIALALPACAHGVQSSNVETSALRPGGQAAQPGSWVSANDEQKNVTYAEHAGPRGRAAQPYAWVGSQPAYPATNRLAQEGPSYLGGRAGQPSSWTRDEERPWSLEVRQLALRESGRAQQ
jgi:hypothetical protein